MVYYFRNHIMSFPRRMSFPAFSCHSRVGGNLAPCLRRGDRVLGGDITVLVSISVCSFAASILLLSFPHSLVIPA
ncbi:hypothetical protein [Candidatus Tisiphia endosymbiont of Hybos culiciformis]|uniref:hypothetical protein n=1 Tax=Candidatus Tisiphia endosymbiont of Hybos culiciformis TaxID=3139331 RepID=UPI003CCB5589